MAPYRDRPSDRGLFVIHVLPTAFFVFEPVLVLLAVGHGGVLSDDVPVNLLTLVICAIGGVVGWLLIVILNLLGIAF
jgi:hypothetical protein